MKQVKKFNPSRAEIKSIAIEARYENRPSMKVRVERSVEYIQTLPDTETQNGYGYCTWDGLEDATAALAELGIRRFSEKDTYFGKNEAIQLAKSKHRAFLANRIGLQKTAAAIYSTCDPKAMLVYEQMGGKWDSQCVWGLSPKGVERIWYIAGCRNSEKYRSMLAYEIRMHKANGRTDNHIGAAQVVRKSFSSKQTKNALRGAAFVSKRQHNLEGAYSLRKKDYIAIGRVSLPLRYALLAGRTESNQPLNYAYAAEVQKWTKAQKATLLSPKEAWFYLYNRCPFQGKQIPNAALLAKWGKAAGAFAQLVKEFSPKDDEQSLELRLPIFNLAALFGSYNEVKKFVGGRWTYHAVHDAGQFTLPTDFTPQFWSGFCMSNRKALRYSALFGKIEREFGAPKNMSQLRDWASQFTYEGAKDNPELAVLCAKLGQDQDTFDAYKVLYSSVKQSESCPHIDITSGSYRMYKLQAADVRGALLGLMTDCCQHLNGAGRSCAVHGVQDPTSAFYVVEYKGDIIAQSWAWRSKKDALVFDSIEGLRGYDYNAVAELFLQAATNIVGRLGINKVLVGNTNYGITSDVKRYFKEQGREMAAFSEEMRSKCSYMDGREQWELFSNGRPVEKYGKSVTQSPAYNADVLCAGSDVFCEHCDAEVHPDCIICPSCGRNIENWV